MKLFLLITISLITNEVNCGLNLFQLALKFLSVGQNRFDQEIPNQENLLSHYDFVIVGAGSAGCTLAARLSENPNWNILLLEAGSNENFFMDIPMAVHFLQGFEKINWGYKTEATNTSCLAMNGNQCNWPRGKVMGGSSVLNYMVYTRGHPKDYEKWSALGNEGWNFENVSYYFRKMENNVVPNATPNYHGKNGPLTVSEVIYKSEAAKAFVAAGMEKGYPYVDYNGPSQIGFSYLQATIENGIRKSTNAAYLYPIKHRRNLHVRKNCRVTKVLIDDNKNAYGVRFYTNKKYYTVNVTKEVILSAGALNTPQIMMLSGIGPTKHLRAAGINPLVNSAVGYNLMDHTAPGALTFVVNTSTPLNAFELLDLNVIDEYLNRLDGPLTSAGGVESIAFLDTEKNSYDPNSYPDLEFLQVGGSINSDPIFKSNFGIRDDVFDEMFAHLESINADTFMVFPMVMRPKSRGRIKLRSNNPFEAPAIFPNYFSDKYDIDISVRGIKKLIDISKTNAFRKLNARFLSIPVPGCKHLIFASDEYWDCYTRHFTFTIYHHCGTAKMGPRSDKRAVVDPQLRVYGVKGLRVVDASIIPEIITGHTNAPVIMIAEKAADLIKNFWKFSS